MSLVIEIIISLVLVGVVYRFAVIPLYAVMLKYHLVVEENKIKSFTETNSAAKDIVLAQISSAVEKLEILNFGNLYRNHRVLKENPVLEEEIRSDIELIHSCKDEELLKSYNKFSKWLYWFTVFNSGLLQTIAAVTLFHFRAKAKSMKVSWQNFKSQTEEFSIDVLTTGNTAA
ncbi:hypothetical protein [Sedimentisphaera salicampi]|uniref:hypothetical protein n=1 Tax=Sedimentisphaera salicampi TaxID=1941349 RepID=UPI000B9C2764|nr:hypothetical protein [Sedimentisphaera salicampi]OXU14738.1 hypothetical protein SMSP1_01511 [Sedimentisphaera salicampi]